eukprot:PhF_6_TR40674/c0_g1_i2/m.61102
MSAFRIRWIFAISLCISLWAALHIMTSSGTEKNYDDYDSKGSTTTRDVVHPTPLNNYLTATMQNMVPSMMSSIPLFNVTAALTDPQCYGKTQMNKTGGEDDVNPAEPMSLSLHRCIHNNFKTETRTARELVRDLLLRTKKVMSIVKGRGGITLEDLKMASAANIGRATLLEIRPPHVIVHGTVFDMGRSRPIIQYLQHLVKYNPHRFPTRTVLFLDVSDVADETTLTFSFYTMPTTKMRFPLNILLVDDTFLVGHSTRRHGFQFFCPK